MYKERNLFVDDLRGLAALYVMIAHFFGPFLNDSIPLLLHFAQEAVVFFFVLSGYYSRKSINGKQTNSLTSYLLSKFIRIYPIFLFSILLTILVEFFVFNVSEIDFIVLFGNLFNLQDLPQRLGCWIPYIGHNYVLWYLGYQWWFYIFFYYIFRYVGDRPVPIWCISIIGMFLFYYFKDHSFLLLWKYYLFAVGANLFICKNDIKSINLQIVLLVLFFFVIGGLYYIDKSFIVLVEECRHFIFALLILCLYRFRFIWKKGINLQSLPILRFFRNLSPFSYSIFLFQMPIFFATTSFIGDNLLAATIAIFETLLISWLIETKLLAILLKKR